MNQSNNRVVIFDDEQDILSICTLILEDHGWEVSSFTDCNNIVERITNLLPVAILMDNKIPETGGVAATRLLKNTPAIKHIPVIYFSANTDIELLARQAGAETYLAKPFDLDELQQAILVATNHENSVQGNQPAN